LAGDRKDHQRLERLKSERQEKINELKEKTNYYITQQLIQVRTQDHGLFSAVLMVKISLQWPFHATGLNSVEFCFFLCQT
jgi:hypothetical protein